MMLATMKRMDLAQATTWREAFSAWLELQYSSELTRKAYEQDVSHFCCWYKTTRGQEFEPGLINILSVRMYHDYLEKVVRCMPATWNRRRTALGILAMYIEEAYGYKIESIKKTVPVMSETVLAPKAISFAQRNKLMDHLQISVNTNLTKKRPTTFRERWLATRNRSLISLMAYCGLRIGEALGLEENDVEVGERKGWIMIHGAISKNAHTGKVSIPKETNQLLKEWLEIRKEMPIGESKMLFPSEKGCQLKPRGIQEMIAELSSALGIKFSAHPLRHTTIKCMIDSGAQLNQVQAIARHKKTETTMKYMRPTEADLEHAAQLGEMGR